MEPQTNSSPVQPMPMQSVKTSSGIDQNLAGLLCYLFAPLAGIVFLIIEKDSKFVKFHALQSLALCISYIVAFVLISILSIIFAPFSCLGFLLFVGYAAIVIILMIKSYQNEMYKLPILGDFVEKNFMK